MDVFSRLFFCNELVEFFESAIDFFGSFFSWPDFVQSWGFIERKIFNYLDDHVRCAFRNVYLHRFCVYLQSLHYDG